jgi:uncharacterized membrane protein
MIAYLRALLDAVVAIVVTVILAITPAHRESAITRVR